MRIYSVLFAVLLVSIFTWRAKRKKASKLEAKIVVGLMLCLPALLIFTLSHIFDEPLIILLSPVSLFIISANIVLFGVALTEKGALKTINRHMISIYPSLFLIPYFIYWNTTSLSDTILLLMSLLFLTMILTVGVISRQIRVGRISELAFAYFGSVLAILTIIIGFARLYVGLKVSHGGYPIEIADAIYFSIITWTTVGYGDIAPTGTARGVAAVEALTGYIFMALLISATLEIFKIWTEIGDLQQRQK